MRRCIVLGLIIILGAAALPGGGAQSIRARENTVVGETSFAIMSQPAGTPSSEDQSGIRLDRLHVAPGADYSIPTDGDALLVVSIESGALTVSATAPLTVTRAAGPDEAATQEAVTAAAEVMLEPGDAFVRPSEAALTLRNDGQQPAVAMTARVPVNLIAGAARGIESMPMLQGDTGLVMALAVVIPPRCPEGYAPADARPEASPGAGGGGGGSGTVAVAVAEAPVCAEGDASSSAALSATPAP